MIGYDEKHCVHIFKWCGQVGFGQELKIALLHGGIVLLKSAHHRSTHISVFTASLGGVAKKER